MHPILLDFGTYDLPLFGATHLFLPTYGLLFALGALAAGSWFIRRGTAEGVPFETTFNLAFYSLLAGIIGAKATLFIVDWREYLRHPIEILYSFRTAGVLLGGVLVAALTFTAYCLRQGLPLLRLGDAAAAPLALAQGIGRLGCFSAGCCYGVPATGPLAVTFTDPAAQAQTGVPLGVPLVPVQLLQMVHDVALAGILTWLYRRRIQADGSVFWWYVILYGIGRSILELWRGDLARGIFFGGHVSTSQLLSAVGVIFASAMLARGALRRPKGA